MIPAGDLLRRRCFVWSLSARTWLHGGSELQLSPAAPSCCSLIGCGIISSVWIAWPERRRAAGGKDTCTGRPINGLCVWCGHPTVVTAQIYLVLTWMDGAGHLVPSQPNPRMFWAQARPHCDSVEHVEQQREGRARGSSRQHVHERGPRERYYAFPLFFFFGFFPLCQICYFVKDSVTRYIKMLV